MIVLTATRRLGRIRLAIWQIMAGGALLVLVTGQISPAKALHAVNPDVMLFLFGAFVMGEALVKSGELDRLAYHLFRHAKSSGQLVFTTIFGMGLLSALLMNDTLAVVGTPLMLRLAGRCHISPQLLLLALAFGVTTGSVMSPIGNPQNLLIAVHGNLPTPFLTFARYLAIPTLISLAVAYGMLRWLYRDAFHRTPLVHTPPPGAPSPLVRPVRIGAALGLGLIVLQIGWAAVGGSGEGGIRLSIIALAAAAPILASREGLAVVRRIDWPTLAFFAAMFVLTASVWQTGALQALLTHFGLALTTVPAVLAVSIALSQLISNVPLVALYLPALAHEGVSPQTLTALAAGSTLAGNLFILGAASNVIIVQGAERHGGPTLSTARFARIGIPLTLVQGTVYWLCLRLAG